MTQEDEIQKMVSDAFDKAFSSFTNEIQAAIGHALVTLSYRANDNDFVIGQLATKLQEMEQIIAQLQSIKTPTFN